MLRTYRRRQAVYTAARACSVSVLVVLLTSTSSVQAAETCTPVIATMVSIQGTVELRRSAAARAQQIDWQSAELNSTLCAGDTVRTHERSRAALLLTNDTTLRLDQRTTLTVVAPSTNTASLLELARGVLHVITRTARPFKVSTPFVNANVEGTEFLVSVGDESASVAVYEGRVTADNDRGSVALTSGERAIAARNSAPRKEVVVRPRDAAQWTLYFPTIFDYRLGIGGAQGPTESALQESVELYRKGRLADAIARVENVPGASGNPRLLIYRAGLLLLVGRLDEAKPEIERALALDPRNSDAYSLQAVIAVVENDKDLALGRADKAVERDPASPVARIALSYAQQAQFMIEQARASVQKAVDLDPQNALAWARLAELEMSAGNLDRALDAAKQAAGLNPGLAKTQTVLGFSYLARIDTRAAKTAFEKAIELDSADPLPRLGSGLAKIREGDLESGRKEIEIAVSLDPETSLIRSYLGKAYYEEGRFKLAGTQFDLAKTFDSNDPTPWFYDAIRKESENRSVEALTDLQKSIELNGNRGVYRSRFLLDEDRAARSISLARVYQEVGFDQLAAAEGAVAVSTDFGNYSAHRFLSDVYSTLPRQVIAQQSEQLQFLLRQPEINAPVSPFRAQDTFTSTLPRAGIVRSISQVRPAYNEFNSLFDRNKLSLYVDALGGQRKTWGDQLIVSGIQDSLSFNLGQGHFETAGFGENQHFRQDAYIGIVQARPRTDISVQAELRETTTERGDFIVPFDPSLTVPIQLKGRVRSARIGAYFGLAPSSNLIVSVIHQTRDLDLTAYTFGNVQSFINDRSSSGEAQWYYRSRPFYIVAGASYLTGTEEFVGNFKQNATARSVYLYGEVQPENLGLRLQGALSASSLDEDPFKKKRIDPKLGLIWTPTSDTTVRAAATRTLQRPLIANQTIEPTQVGGFNQFFDNADGTEDSRVAVGLDQKLSRDTFIGFEVARAKMKVPLSLGDSVSDFDWTERTGKAYLYWKVQRDRQRIVLPDWSAAVAIQYEAGHIRHPEELPGDDGIIRLDTQALSIGLVLFPFEPFFAQCISTHVRQTGRLQAGTGFDAFDVNERFWTTDISLNYRIPGRRGTFAVGASNVFDRDLQGFQELDKANPRFAARRIAFARLVMQF